MPPPVSFKLQCSHHSGRGISSSCCIEKSWRSKAGHNGLVRVSFSSVVSSYLCQELSKHLIFTETLWSWYFHPPFQTGKLKPRKFKSLAWSHTAMWLRRTWTQAISFQRIKSSLQLLPCKKLKKARKNEIAISWGPENDEDMTQDGKG